jgi:hypothetical protein
MMPEASTDRMQFALGITDETRHRQFSAIGAHPAHAVVVGIGDIDVPGRIGGQAPQQLATAAEQIGKLFWIIQRKIEQRLGGRPAVAGMAASPATGSHGEVCRAIQRFMNGMVRTCVANDMDLRVIWPIRGYPNPWSKFLVGDFRGLHSGT